MSRRGGGCGDECLNRGPKSIGQTSVVVTGGGKRGGSGTPPRSTKHFDTESSSCICFCCFETLEPFSSTFMDHVYGMI